jgi:sugar lactone lactonase YvrE
VSRGATTARLFRAIQGWEQRLAWSQRVMAADLMVSGPKGVGSPAFSPDGQLYVVYMTDGSICQVDAETWTIREVDNTGGQPGALCFDARGAAHVADLAMGAVMHKAAGFSEEARGSEGEEEEEEGEAAPKEGAAWLTSVVDYEGEPLRGPSSLALDGSGTLYFTDSGPLGDTTLENPRGSVFAVAGTGRGKYLKPLMLRCLAHPCALATGTTDNVL